MLNAKHPGAAKPMPGWARVARSRHSLGDASGGTVAHQIHEDY